MRSLGPPFRSSPLRRSRLGMNNGGRSALRGAAAAENEEDEDEELGMCVCVGLTDARCDDNSFRCH